MQTNNKTINNPEEVVTESVVKQESILDVEFKAASVKEEAVVKNNIETSNEPKVEVKKLAEKKPAAKKPIAKKAASKTKDSTAEKPAAKKKVAVTEKKEETKKAIKSTVVIQYNGIEIEESDIIEKIKKNWVSELGKKISDLKTLTTYIKPEEQAAYYVINEDITGRIEF